MATNPNDRPFLTPRQLEVLELLAAGLQNREIADALGISPATVKRHVSAVIDALDVTNRTEAARALHELGLGSREESSSADTPVEGFGARPAIAVLPFQNLSSDPEQEFLADGIVEDLTTRLAAWRWFPVIARNSTFAYKGQQVDVKEVSRALGARYVVEGSVRRSGDRVRVTAQLIDGVTGKHVWADRYDRQLADVFDVENDLVDSLVAALEPGITKIEGIRHSQRPPADLNVWEALSRGFVHTLEHTWEGVEAAQPFFERALSLAPNECMAHVSQAYVGVHALVYQRTRDLEEQARQVTLHARRALEIDAGEALAHVTLGWGQLYSGDPQAALASHRNALSLNPSVVWAWWGAGAALLALENPQPDEAAAALETVLRLSPNDPFLNYVLLFLGGARLIQERWQDAWDCFQRSQLLAPDQPFAYPWLALIHIISGQMPEAKDKLARMAEIDPSFSPATQNRFTAADKGKAVSDILALAGWQDPQPRD